MLNDKQEIKNIIKNEIKKCIIDPAYFCRKYCYILHQKRGKILFDLYDFQQKALRDFQQNDRLLILKSRQLGISTLCAAFALWFALFNEGKNILIVSKKQKDATGLITKIKIMHKNLPSWLKNYALTTTDNQMSIGFTNDSKIEAEATSENTGRSTSNAVVIVDEAAFIRSFDSVWTSLQSTTDTGGKIIILSTPNGVGNTFYKLWTEAEAGDNDFKTIKLKWNVHPEHDQNWRNLQTKRLGFRQASQECDCDFLTSGNLVIDNDVLLDHKNEFIRDPIEKTGPGNLLWIWKYPEPGKEYLLVADVARGDGSDFSACHVLEVESCEQCAEFKGQISTREFANLLVSLGINYNEALLAVENASIGWDVIQEIISLQYRKIYYTNRQILTSDPRYFLNKQFDVGDSNMVPGFTNSSKTRPLIISKLEQYFNEKALIIHSIRTHNELMSFVWLNGKPQSQIGYNDDLVLALAIGLFIRDTYSRLNKTGLDLTRKTIESIASSITTGVAIQKNQKAEEQWQMKTGINKSESLTWLVG